MWFWWCDCWFTYNLSMLVMRVEILEFDGRHSVNGCISIYLLGINTFNFGIVNIKDESS